MEAKKDKDVYEVYHIDENNVGKCEYILADTGEEAKTKVKGEVIHCKSLGTTLRLLDIIW